jgi:glucokinase
MIVEPDGRPCGCGQKGCLEAYAAASRVAERADEALQTARGRDSALQGRELDAAAVFTAMEEGDALATELVQETARVLGLGLVSLCRLFDPRMILFGGGMAAAGESLFGPVREAFLARTWGLLPEQVHIGPSVLGGDAGVVGAGAAAYRTFSAEKAESS